MAVNNDDAIKQIFSRCLLNCLQVPLWYVLNLIMAMVDVLVSFTPFWMCCLKSFGCMREVNVECRMTQIGLSVSFVYLRPMGVRNSLCFTVVRSPRRMP